MARSARKPKSETDEFSKQDSTKQDKTISTPAAADEASAATASDPRTAGCESSRRTTGGLARRRCVVRSAFFGPWPNEPACLSGLQQLVHGVATQNVLFGAMPQTRAKPPAWIR